MHEFTVWAPNAKKVAVKMGDALQAMSGPDEYGWWRATVADVDCGTDYAFVLDDDPKPYPDPRSQWQPHGVHGPSRLYDQKNFVWNDHIWQGPPLSSAVIYEMHLGTFSPEGTFDGAIKRLDHLVELGITHVEMMPIAEFAGDRGWGYDGVALFAVQENYGGPEALKRFVDACHCKAIGVLLDVVYNHFGPVGAYAMKFGPYLTNRHRTPWGDAVNFDGVGSDEVRRYFCDNALMWMCDFHIDGLRLDAVHEFFDRSAVHFMEQLSAEVEVMAATLGRRLLLIAESDLNDPKVVTPREAGGYGMDAQWSDDFHHALFTLLHLEEKSRGYYADYSSLGALAKSLAKIFVYDGEYSKARKRKHGRPISGLSAHHFIIFIQNHDQVGNRATGDRLQHIVGTERSKVALGLVLTSPGIAMLFQGEEYAASTPFLYFAEMAKAVVEGRRRDFNAFGYDRDQVPNPENRETFERSKLDWDEVHEGEHGELLEWCRKLIHLRRTSPALNDGDMGHVKVDFSEEKRWLAMKRGPVQVLCNLGSEDASFDVPQGYKLVLASTSRIDLSEGKVTLVPDSAAIVSGEAA